MRRCTKSVLDVKDEIASEGKAAIVYEKVIKRKFQELITAIKEI